MSNVSVKNENFKYGLINKYEAKSIPRGSQSDGYNFFNLLDKIEFSRGRYRLGPEILGNGKITGLHVAEKADGTQILIGSYGTNLVVYDDATETWTNIKNNLTANVENSFANYHSLAGAQCWMSNPKDGMFKMMCANITDEISMYDSAKNFKGKIRIKDNRTILWNTDQDKTGLYLSYIDAGQNYTTVSSEVVGALGSKTYSGTLAFKGGGAKRTCFGVNIIEAGGESFTDDYNGNLVGSAGGTGTINYATGAYSVTFNAITTGAVTANYQWEDSTNQGIADFTKSSPRQAGQGAIFRQDVGGDQIQNVMNLGDDWFSLKRVRTYRLTLTNDDTNATNIVYRERAGIPNWRAACETEEGIFFIDDSTEQEPKLRIFKPAEQNALIIPVSATESVNLGWYYFDKCEMVAWGDYVVFTGRTMNSDENDTMFFFHKVYRSIFIRKWSISHLAIYNGSLIGGESISNNIFALFSGFDEEDFGYDAEWISNNDNLNINGLKKVKRLKVEGYIGKNQKIFVYVSYDDDAFQLLIDNEHPDGAIDGQSNYVEKAASSSLGSQTLGRLRLGGRDGVIDAYHFYTEFKLNSPKFEKMKVKFKILGDNIGYAAISSYEYFDIRVKRNHLPAKYN